MKFSALSRVGKISSARCLRLMLVAALLGAAMTVQAATPATAATANCTQTNVDGDAVLVWRDNESKRYSVRRVQGASSIWVTTTTATTFTVEGGAAVGYLVRAIAADGTKTDNSCGLVLTNESGCTQTNRGDAAVLTIELDAGARHIRRVTAQGSEWAATPQSPIAIFSNGADDRFVVRVTDNSNQLVDYPCSVVDGGAVTPTCAISGRTVATTLDQSECDALVDLYRSTAGDAWTQNRRWLTASDPCTWIRVLCNLDGHVESLEMRNNGLDGHLPASISGLTYLAVLVIDSNSIDSLPPTIGDLTNLREFADGYNDYRTLPDSIGGLEALVDFRFVGTLDALPESFGELTNLARVELFSPGVGQSPTALPDSFGNLRSLRELEIVGWGAPFDRLPDSFTGLIALETLTIRDTGLAELPADLGYLTALSELWVGSNNLNALPGSVGQLQNLEYLTLGRNNVASLPEELGLVTSLLVLDVSFNQISEFPESLDALSNLSQFSFTSNNLTEFPEWLPSLPALRIIHPSKNPISGDITALATSWREFGVVESVRLFDGDGGLNCLSVTDPALDDYLDDIGGSVWDDCR